MLCKFCSNIDLDRLATPEGYKHHASCADLHQSARDGCLSCRLILKSQWIEVGGALEKGYDQGPLETQIVARTKHQKPGSYHKIYYGQNVRYERHCSNLMTGSKAVDNDVSPESPEFPFLHSFLKIAAIPSSRSSTYLKLRPLSHRSSKNWLSCASSWLEDCLDNHEACSPQCLDTIQLPTRVIDVGPSDGSKVPFLHISGDDVQQWVTLSHCWGQTQPLRTTRGSLREHQQALQMEKLPKLFHDAVIITRSLGYRYFWIDSLCIIQDSEEDWMREISNMGNIYKHCVFMISADNCRDSGESVLGNHVSVDTQYVQQGCRSSIEGFHSFMYTWNDRPWERSGWYTGFLGSRAWTLQEEVLSPRTLRWTSLQLEWSCRCATHSEEDPSRFEQSDLYFPTKIICLSDEGLRAAKQDHLKLHGPNTDAGECHPMMIWYCIVKDFCSRNMTFQEDAFPAISGLAKEVNRHTGFDYQAGIWDQDYHHGLLWSMDRHTLHPSTYVAPSWSWAAVCGGNTLHLPIQGPKFTGVERSLKPIAEILQTEIVYSGKDKFGSIRSGRLRIRAPCETASTFTIRLPLTKDKIPQHGNGPSAYKVQPSTITCWLDDRGSEEDGEDSFGAIKLQLCNRGVILVHIGSLQSDHVVVPDTKNYYLQRYQRSLQDQHWSLILERATGDAGEWKRIGIARIADGLLDGWETRDVTII